MHVTRISPDSSGLGVLMSCQTSHNPDFTGSDHPPNQNTEHGILTPLYLPPRLSVGPERHLTGTHNNAAITFHAIPLRSESAPHQENIQVLPEFSDPHDSGGKSPRLLHHFFLLEAEHSS